MSYGIGNLKASVEEAWKICQDANLGTEQNTEPRYGRIGAALMKPMSYREEWQRYIDKREFNILLRDQSVIQFKWSDEERALLSYAYYENPLEALSYDEFLLQTYGEADPTGSEHLDIYGEYLATADPKPHVMPIRYDFSPGLYTAGLHPASHLHMGHRNTVRIGTRRILRPTSFVLLIIRQVYPSAWQTLMRHNQMTVRCAQVHTNLTPIKEKHFTADDAKEMYLS